MDFRSCLVAALFIAGALAACSGQNSSSVLPDPGLLDSRLARAGATLVVALTVPRFSGNLRSRYISPSTQSLRVVEGKKSLGIFETTKSTKGCRSSSTGLSCRFAMTAVAGKRQRFTITTYDAANARGSILANTTVVRKVPSGKTTMVSLTLSGVPASIVVTPLPSTMIIGDQSDGFMLAAGDSATLLISALDSDGNYIIGQGAPKLSTTVTGTGGLSLTAVTNGNSNAYLLHSTGVGSGTLSVSASQPATSIKLTTLLVSAPTVATFAGTPLVNGFVDGAPGTGELSNGGAVSLAYDTATSNLYISDQAGCALRVANRSGTLSTIYGGVYNVVTGCPHNGMRDVTALTYDTFDHNLYAFDIYDVSSTLYCEVSRISPTGTFTSVAGGTPCATPHDGIGTGASFLSAGTITFDTDNGLLYIVDGAGNLRSISTSGTVTTIATVATERLPLNGLVYTGGKLYTAEGKWVEVISLTGAVTLLAGGGNGYSDGTGTNANFSSAWGIADDAHDGVLIVSDACTIRTVTPAGTVTTVAGLPGVCSYLAAGTLGSQVLFGGLLPSVAYDSLDNVAYVSDQYNEVIRRLAL